MFLKYLLLTNNEGLIRRIDFRMGVNLIIDETPSGTSATGNNVGKTTILRLIDFCLGGDQKEIYASKENGVNQLVMDFLKETETVVELCLTESLQDPDSRKVIVRRNFVGGRKALREIDGKQVLQDDFDSTIQQALFGFVTDKPSYRQIISHNFRMDEQRLNHTLHTIHKYATGTEYEALHLYLFGANLKDTARKIALTETIRDDVSFKKRLEEKAGVSQLKSTLAVIENQIKQLEEQKAAYPLNADFEQDLEELTKTKQTLSQLAVRQNSFNLRRRLIREAADEVRSMKSRANAHEVAAIYQQAQVFVPNLQHTFEELLSFHNEMLSRKADFIAEELPELDKLLNDIKEEIATCREQERELEKKLNLSVTFEQFDKLITKLNGLYQQQGRLKESIDQIEEVEKRIACNEQLVGNIDRDLYANSYKDFIQKQLDKFNVRFSTISSTLYDESYAISYEVAHHNGKSYYKFKTFATDNYSTGKKQGEIVCFDLAYITFADEEGIPCLHFVLNDKKELMHGNQLLGIARQSEEQGNVQYVASILSDKCPERLEKNRFVVQTLSQDNRLFKIEHSAWYLAR